MSHKFTFPALFSITIESSRFHLGIQALEFPQVSKFIIAECPHFLPLFQERVVMKVKTWLAKGASMVALQPFSALREVWYSIYIYLHNLFHIFFLFDQHEYILVSIITCYTLSNFNIIKSIKILINKIIFF